MGHETAGPALRGGIVGCGKEIGVGAEAIEVLAGRVDYHERQRCVAELADVVLLQVIEPNLAHAAPLVAEYLQYGRFDSSCWYRGRHMWQQGSRSGEPRAWTSDGDLDTCAGSSRMRFPGSGTSGSRLRRNLADGPVGTVLLVAASGANCSLDLFAEDEIERPIAIK